MGTKTRGAVYRDDDTFGIPNFEKYVDEKFDPLIDNKGDGLFEVEVVNNPDLDLSADAKIALRTTLDLTVKAARSSR